MKIIAEIGLNHCGSVQRGIDLVNNLIHTSIDGITFQIREKEFYDKSHPRKVELPMQFYNDIAQKIDKGGKDFGLSISNIKKIRDFNKIGIKFWKTLSWDITNRSLQNELQKTNKKVFVSTGISGIDEIIDNTAHYQNIVLIHTQLDYSLKNTNLKAILTMRNDCKREIAFGLHSRLHEVLFTAVGYEPNAIFFYVKDNTGLENPDDEHAISISDVEIYVKKIKSLSETLGNGVKLALENTLHPEDDEVCN
tara:strand:- start:90 stop:842 length:753 start_codon:yes stop_codon:yes gene_type:complete